MEAENAAEFCNNCKRLVSSANFATHSAFCERNIFVCKMCDEPVQISEKKEHLEEFHVIAPCDLCEVSIEKWMLPQHMEICPKRLELCKYCEADFPLDEYAEHVEFCGSRTEKCLLCQKYIMNKEKSNHDEFHMLEKQYRTKNIEEIKQNEVNETMNNKRHTIEKTSKSTKSVASMMSEGGDTRYVDKLKNTNRKEDQKLESPTHLGAAASLPEKGRSISKHYTQCHICKEAVPWIDYNTHVPSCASSAGKCSMCGESVPSHAIKEHMKRHFQGKLDNQSVQEYQHNNSRSGTAYRNNENYGAENEVCDAIFECPYCSQQCSKDRILEHTRNCLQNVYECPLCCKKIPEKDKKRHETSECSMIHNNNVSDRSYNSRKFESFFECPLCHENVPEEDRDNHSTFKCRHLFDSSEAHGFYGVGHDSYMFECPYCSEKMPQKDRDKHQSFFCKVLIANSGVNIIGPETFADVTKKTCHSNCKCPKHLEDCSICKNSFPKEKISEHRSSCRRLKVHCPRCGEMIDRACEDIHLQYCSAVIDNKKYTGDKSSAPQNSRFSYNEPKGAIPKNSNIFDMMKPRAAKCKYCCTTLNVDILKYHEDECIHKPIQCPNCSTEILLKDIHSHKCKKKKVKGKNSKREQQISDGNNQDGIWEKAKKFFSITDEKDEVKSEHMSINHRHHYESHNYVPVNTNSSGKLYFEQTDDTLLPCEFCQQIFPASELVLHETGCQPHLVSFAKPDSFEKKKSDSSQEFAGVDSKSTSQSQNIRAAGVRETFFTEKNSFLPSARLERIEKNRELRDKAGEFLQSHYSKNSEYHEYPIKKDKNIDDKKAEPLNFQSVWNAVSPNDLEIEEYDRKQFPDHSCIEMTVDETEDITDMNERQKEDMEVSDQQVSEKQPHDDNEMTAMLKFVNKNESTESDEEFISLSDEEEKPQESERKMCGVMELKDNIREKYSGDSLVSKKSVDEESRIMCQDILKCMGNIEKNLEEYSSYEYLKVLSEKSREPEKLLHQKNSKYNDNTEDDMKYIRDFRQYLPDFKFGVLEANVKSSKDYVSNTILHEKKSSNDGEKAFMIEPDYCVSSRTISDKTSKKQHIGASSYIDNFKNGNDQCVNTDNSAGIKYSKRVISNEDSRSGEKCAFTLEQAGSLLKECKLPFVTASKMEEKKLEGLEERIAALQRKNQKNLIHDATSCEPLDMTVSSQRYIYSETDEITDDISKWKKWRAPKDSCDSD